jgi:hypothetical protein
MISSGIHRPRITNAACNQSNHSTNKRKNNIQLQEAISKIDLFVLCDKIYHLEKQGGYYFSPLRDDGNNPASSIRDDGKVCIDHGTGDGFNVVTLIAKVERLSRSEAYQRLEYYAANLGIDDSALNGRERKSAKPAGELVRHDWALGAGSHQDYLDLAALRRLDAMALITATAHGLLFFTTDAGARLYTVTDNARHVRQDRRLDGAEVTLAGGGITKSRSLGTASWPVGAANVGNKPVVLLVEGMPDLLAAAQVITQADRWRDTAPVAVLGAGQRIHPEALPLLARKRVRIFPHRDEAGSKAAITWQRQLLPGGTDVDYIPYPDDLAVGTTPVKDLNDVLIAMGGDETGNFIPDGATKGGQ